MPYPLMESVLLCYPHLNFLARAIRQLPIKAQSLPIKQCQAQYNIVEPIRKQPLPRIVQLLDSFPPPTITTRDGEIKRIPLRGFFNYFGANINDPLESAIILDLLRGLQVTSSDSKAQRTDGWLKEIRLAESTERNSEINFEPFFTSSTLIHPDIPHNFPNLIRIRNIFRQFRQKLIDQNRLGKLNYARATHKTCPGPPDDTLKRCLENMRYTGSQGQDDWQRVYHEHGIELEGDVELRQKWYPSGAKPRSGRPIHGRLGRRTRWC